MRRIAVCAILGLCCLTLIGAQESRLGNTAIHHVAVVVPDIAKATQLYKDVLGIRPWVERDSTFEQPDGTKLDIKVALFDMANFRIELDQPVTPRGFFHDWLQQYGPSVEHVGVAVKGDMAAARATLEQSGARYEGSPRGPMMNLKDSLGIAFELNGVGPYSPIKPVNEQAGGLPPLGTLKVTHVGFAATDADKYVEQYARVVGIEKPRVMEYKDSQYPAGTKWDPKAFLRLAQWPHENVRVEVIASVGQPTPWSEFVKSQKGTPGLQHIAIDVGDTLDERIRDLVAKGGKWTNGKPGGSYAYIDFQDSLGLAFELNGTSKSAGLAK